MVRERDARDSDAGDCEPTALLMGPVDLAERDDAKDCADDGQRQTWATIRSGLGAGLQEPKDLDADDRSPRWRRSKRQGVLTLGSRHGLSRRGNARQQFDRRLRRNVSSLAGYLNQELLECQNEGEVPV